MNTYLSRRYDQEKARAHPAPQPAPAARIAEAEQQLLQLESIDEYARTYLEKHLSRLARTLTLVPPSTGLGAILELGCYGQITPFLKTFCGYSSVRGAHFGPLGITENKILKVQGRPSMPIKVDLFDADRDPFPYASSTFETILASEIIEHLIYDPMHMLLECHRVLVEGGRLLVTTPNTTSLTSVARVLNGFDNPQLYSKYSIPGPDGAAVPHVREYTAFELGDALKAAGFEIETLITEPIAEWNVNLPMWNFLEDHGYNTSLRGEQTYCIGIKRATLPVTRYPIFLYS